MREPLLEVLYEDNHCLAVAKPAGLLTMGFAGAPETLIDRARAYIKTKYRKPGNVFLGVVHRLDKPVSGIVLFARTSKAAARLAEQFRRGTVEKTYWAVVEGRPPLAAAEWTDRLWKNPATGKVEVVAARRPPKEARLIAPSPPPSSPRGRRQGERETGPMGPPAGSKPDQSKEARVRVRLLARLGTETLVELQPVTGRTHQLRIQLASRGLPIVGDRRYGARSAFEAGIALHAIKLRFKHPTRDEWIAARAPLPESWRKRWPQVPTGT